MMSYLVTSVAIQNSDDNFCREGHPTFWRDRSAGSGVSVGFLLGTVMRSCGKRGGRFRSSCGGGFLPFRDVVANVTTRAFTRMHDDNA